MPVDNQSSSGEVRIGDKTYTVDFSEFRLQPPEDPTDFCDPVRFSTEGTVTFEFEFTGFLRALDLTERRAYLLRRPMGRA